jgi:hypothetical protein
VDFQSLVLAAVAEMIRNDVNFMSAIAQRFRHAQDPRGSATRIREWASRDHRDP